MNEERAYAQMFDGRLLLVADGLVDAPVAARVQEMLADAPFRMHDYDREDTKAVRHLVHELPTEAVEDHPLLSFLDARARSLANEHGASPGELRRAYVNLNLHGDFQFAHQDGDVWTAVFFAAGRWHEDWGGELIAYQGRPAAGIGLSISPRPGRMVVFDGLIWHRGGAPSRLCHEPRLTLVLKYAR